MTVQRPESIVHGRKGGGRPQVTGTERSVPIDNWKDVVSYCDVCVWKSYWKAVFIEGNRRRLLTRIEGIGRRFGFGHLAFQFAQPPIGASQDLCGAALVASVFSHGAARDGPFKVVQESGE
jgi:hypothetical protein